MRYNLFLDDERIPYDVTWVKLPGNMYSDHVIVRSYNEFAKHIISFGLPDSVSFDHDLADEHYEVMANEVSASQSYSAFVNDDFGGLDLKFDYGTEKTGYDCAKWLVDFCIDRGLKFPAYTVHSMNPIGAKRIGDYIELAKTKMDL